VGLASAAAGSMNFPLGLQGEGTMQALSIRRERFRMQHRSSYVFRTETLRVEIVTVMANGQREWIKSAKNRHAGIVVARKSLMWSFSRADSCAKIAERAHRLLRWK
jgi:hypothetical protein